LRPDPTGMGKLQNRLDWIEAAAGDVVALANDYPDDCRIAPHRHSRAQLLHALSGVVMVSTGQGRWMVPPDHAMWIPAGVEHAVEMLGAVRMRSVYVRPQAAPGLPESLRVLTISELMRSLVIEAGLKRIRPCLMTTGTTILALLPILTSAGKGAEIMIPMAIPAFGGMFALLLSLLLGATALCVLERI
jgi:mannose-6-phosphate isomerase-like protein (cupin superfamily)